MTGQVNFNSHTDGVVRATAELVNAATPGERRGRPYAVPDRGELAKALASALRVGSRIDAAQAGKLAAAAARLRVVFEHVDRGELDAAAGRINALLDELQPTPYLDRHDSQAWHLHYHSRNHDFADGWAASCVTALATVLGSDHADRLGVCSASGCDRVYVDVTRNGTRRFCSTACQNRIKAAAHRARGLAAADRVS
jgi:predicted RNA-binding Zn ribbon-like protein